MGICLKMGGGGAVFLSYSHSISHRHELHLLSRLVVGIILAATRRSRVNARLKVGLLHPSLLLCHYSSTSRGFPESVSWEKEIKSPYFPFLRSFNGYMRILGVSFILNKSVNTIGDVFPRKSDSAQLA